MSRCYACSGHLPDCYCLEDARAAGPHSIPAEIVVIDAAGQALVETIGR